jgi:hypothetical protein
LVSQRLLEGDNLHASFLQGHIGDVNPGGGDPWLGVPEDVADRVAAAVRRAVDGARQVTLDRLHLHTREVQLPLDLKRLGQWLAEYREDPSKCTGGHWVDARFAEDWFASASKWDMGRTTLPIQLTAMQLGDVGLLMHPAELYSFYGLAIRRDSPFDDTLVVGYTDDVIGYLSDPAAYEADEYSAIVVPKICDLPPYRPDTAAVFTSEAIDSLKRLVA